MDFLKVLLLITVFQAIFIMGVSCKKGKKGKKGKKDRKGLTAFNKKLKRYLKTKKAASINKQGCSDEITWCDSYKTYCKNDETVQYYCRKTCNVCVVEEVCEDTHPQCRYIFEKGYCYSYGKYCRKSCGSCKGLTSKCGLAPLNPSQFGRIVDGVAAKKGYFPWQVGIYIGNDFHCGGALIDKRHVISAAHCFNKQEDNYEYMTFTVGDIDRNVDEEEEQTFELRKVTMHPQYVYDSGKNDIVLLELSRDVQFYENYVTPICLPAKGEERRTGTFCSISGWGRQNYLGQEADVLQYVQVPIVEPGKCKTRNNWKDVTETNICTGFDDGTNFKSACFGDSGGPLSCKDSTGVWKLFGTVSWGHPQCNAFEGYSVFTKISSYIDWIEKNKS